MEGSLQHQQDYEKKVGKNAGTGGVKNTTTRIWAPGWLKKPFATHPWKIGDRQRKKTKTRWTKKNAKRTTAFFYSGAGDPKKKGRGYMPLDTSASLIHRIVDGPTEKHGARRGKN